MSQVLINPYAFAVAAESEITVVNTGESNLSFTNKSPHPYTYTLTSNDSANGTLALIVIFIGDHGDVTVTPNKGTAVIDSSHNDGGKVWIGYYVPTSGEIAAGEVDFSFATSQTEVMQYVIYEVTGADLSSLPGSFAVDDEYDGSNAARTTVGPMSVTAPAGSLIISAAAMAGTDFSAELSVQSLNSFTLDYEQVAQGEGDANWIVASRLVSSSDDYDSPVFAQDDPVAELNAGTVVFAPA